MTVHAHEATAESRDGRAFTSRAGADDGVSPGDMVLSAGGKPASWARSSTSRNLCEPLTGFGVVIGRLDSEGACARRTAGLPRSCPGPRSPCRARWPARRAGRHDDDRHVADGRCRCRRQPAGRRLQPAHVPLRAERLGQDLRPRGDPRAAPPADRPGMAVLTPTPTSSTSAPRFREWRRTTHVGSPSEACGCCAATPRVPRATSHCG